MAGQVKMAKKRLKLDDYYQAAKKSLKRIWQNKTIWFWGLFVSSGVYLNFSGNHKEEDRKPLEEGFVNDIWVNYWNWIIAGLIILLVLVLIIWIISGIARSGVIKELDKKQNNKKHKLSFKGIWKIGKIDFKKILILDLWLLGIVIGVLIFDLSLMFLVFLSRSVGLAIIFAIIFGLATILFLIFLAILKPIALMFLVLANLSIKNSFLKSWNLLKNNVKEYLKLILTLFVVSVIGGAFLTLILMLGGILVALLFGFFGGFSGTEVSFLAISLLFILTMIILFVVLATEGLLRLWRTDIMIWWVKEIKGAKVEDEKKVAEKKKVVREKKELAGAKA
jgi:hypothetical protein